VISLQLH